MNLFSFKCSSHGDRCICVPAFSCCPPSSLLCLCSGASRVTASGDPASSLRATMGTGAPGPSWAPAPGRVEEECAPAAGSATTHRKEIKRSFFYDLCSREMTRELKASVKQTSPGFPAKIDFCTWIGRKKKSFYLFIFSCLSNKPTISWNLG